MTVQELMDYLKQCPPYYEVAAGDTTGDPIVTVLMNNDTMKVGLVDKSTWNKQKGGYHNFHGTFLKQ